MMQNYDILRQTKNLERSKNTPKTHTKRKQLLNICLSLLYTKSYRHTTTT